jgi:multidrug resistance efflux pump
MDIGSLLLRLTVGLTVAAHGTQRLIHAPVSRVIGRKTVEPGQRISPGQSLLAIVPVDDIGLTADFKELSLSTCARLNP